jgi:peptidoglycan-associated lipoprotein
MGLKIKRKTMKHNTHTIVCIGALICLLVTGCKSQNNGSVWDDNHTSGNYKGTVRNLWDSMTNSNRQEESAFEGAEEDFIALNDDDLKSSFADGAIPQPHTQPGQKGSPLPGMEDFHAPSGSLASVFKNVQFNTDDHIVRGKDSLVTIERIAEYLKTHKEMYLFIEGHCDERGPEAYNLSLGSRRANYVRTLLIQKGIDPERIHTVSYGKERPVASGHDTQAWIKNRRAEFKVYSR